MDRTEATDGRCHSQRDLVQIVFSQYDSARHHEPPDDFGIFRRDPIAEYSHSFRGRNSGDIDVVLDANRNSMERSALVA
jgi:hypothetical protein